MEDLIERLPKNDLLVLSGFLSSWTDEPIESIVKEAQELANQKYGDSVLADQKTSKIS